ncbi:MAG: acyl-CoA reductase [Bacteroidia bacterium]
MLNQQAIIDALVTLGNRFTSDNEQLEFSVAKTYVENNWLTKENYLLALQHWQSELTQDNLSKFCKPYTYVASPKKVGIIMAGNIPLVGFHDLLCVLLTGHSAVIKPSSDDKYVILLLVKWLQEIAPHLTERLTIVERVKDIDAVIATGSNNSYRYFEHYFKSIPRLLRKNRKSMAVLDGTETPEQLSALADDVFQYYGLGCRNVSFIYLPRNLEIVKVLDVFMKYKELVNHNKYANNYTYHRALLLLNNEQHLDTGFALPKQRVSLHAPLACIHYEYYDDLAEVDTFIRENRDDIQCIVGNYPKDDSIPYGKAQKPDLQDFADGEDTMQFLSEL